MSVAGSDLEGLPFLLDLRAGGPGSQMALGAPQRALGYSLCYPAMHQLLVTPLPSCLMFPSLPHVFSGPQSFAYSCFFYSSFLQLEVALMA